MDEWVGDIRFPLNNKEQKLRDRGLTPDQVRSAIAWGNPDEARWDDDPEHGRRCRNDVASDGFRWVTVGAPGQDVDIVLFQPHGGRSQAEGDALLTLVTQGARDCAFRDPSGNLVRIGQA